MNSFQINLVQILVVVDLFYIYLLIRYPPIHYSLLRRIQSFQALYPGYLLSSIHLNLVCSPLQMNRLYHSLLSSLNDPKVYALTKANNTTHFSSNYAIYDPTYPVPEPDFTSSTGLFDG